MPYYGLYIPAKGATLSSNNNGISSPNNGTLGDSVSDVNNETGTTVLVYQKKFEVLNVLKHHKDARFKEFVTEEEAIKYAQTGFETVQNKYNDVKTSTETLEKAAFRAPTKQQLIHLRQQIEQDRFEYVKKLIWDNPRYLVSSGDTPTILKEGYRYNAMHVCAASQCPKVAKLILDTVSDPKFADLLMGKKNDEKSSKELSANLLDYYLNMPEKGRNETPLHFAVKFGHANIVSILLSYPECRMLRNSQGRLPRYMICERKNRHLYADILKLFDDRYYVPVLRSNDSAIPGQIGEPFSANKPPLLNCDPLSPEMEIKALAGPMSEEQAKKFFRRWKTPPRLGSNVASPIANNPFISPMKPFNSTPNKTSFSTSTAQLQRRSLFNSTPMKCDQNGVISSNGLDKSIGNKSDVITDTDDNKTEHSETNNNERVDNMSKPQTNLFKTNMFPRTPLFKLKKNAFSIYREPNTDSPIVDSLGHVQEINNSLFNLSDVYDSPGFKERHVKNTDIEKGLECIGRVLAKEKNIEWREYWDFLDEFIDIASKQGILKLENYLAQRQREEEKCNEKSISIQKPDILDDVCNALENAFRISTTSSSSTSSTTTSTGNSATTIQSITPYTYVEKSLQVHAKRMTKTIIHNIDNEGSIIDALLSELRRVKSLIYSFKEDASYSNVNFAKVHSRIANLISIFLENSQEVSEQMKENILILLQNISIEQDERLEHMECICSRIVENLTHPVDQVLPENMKTEEICSKIWFQEKDCMCQWESNLSRKTSRRNRMEARYQRHLFQRQQEKLQKDLDNQQKVNNSEDWRKYSTTDSSDDEVFWSDFGDSDSEEDEVFFTPKQSPSRLSLSNNAEEDDNKIFIFGDEPTKRDLDVLNAIFHLDIDKNKYPNIHTWKASIMRYSNEEKDFFPSPRSVKKSHSFVATSSNKKDLFVQPQTPTTIKKSYSIVRSNTSSLILNSSNQEAAISTASSVSSSNSGIIMEPILQLPISKRLFMSPGRTKSMTAISTVNNENSKDDASNAIATKTKAALTEEELDLAAIRSPLQYRIQRPLTPLNKIRGLFSAYRECLDNSPLSTTSTSP